MPHDKRPNYCHLHKAEQMVEVFESCLFPGCKIPPNYGGINDLKASYCYKHKTPNLVNIVTHVCAAEGCQKSSGHSHPDDKRGVYCRDHAPSGL